MTRLFLFDSFSDRIIIDILDGFLLARLDPDGFEVAFKEAPVLKGGEENEY